MFVGSLISVSELDAGLLRYTPPANTHGLGYNGLSFVVHDNGSLDNGGVTIDPVENYIDFDLPGVNDSPQLILERTTVDEGSSNVLAEDVLSATDADDTEPGDLTFRFNSLPTHGVLTLNGSVVSAGDTFTITDLEQDRLRYIHDGSETSIDYFEVQVNDGGEDGSIPATGRFTLRINEVIDPPPALQNEALQLEFGADFNSADGDLLNSGHSTLGHEALILNPFYIVSLETPPARGTVVVNSDGSFTYRHDGSPVLEDSFSFRVTNEDNVFAIATVNIVIEPPLGSALGTEPPPTPTDHAEEKPQENPATTAPEELSREVATSFQSFVGEFDTAIGEAQGRSVDSVSGTIDQVIRINDARLAPLQPTTRSDDPVPEALDVKQHRSLDFAEISDQIKISQVTIDILTEVRKVRMHDIVTNAPFLEGLKQLDRDFAESEETQRKKFQLANDAAMGVSISATAGIVAWILRGGALFASALASTPLWSSIDPVRVLTNQREESRGAEDKEVEQYFSEK